MLYSKKTQQKVIHCWGPQHSFSHMLKSRVTMQQWYNTVPKTKLAIQIHLCYNFIYCPWNKLDNFYWFPWSNPNQNERYQSVMMMKKTHQWASQSPNQFNPTVQTAEPQLRWGIFIPRHIDSHWQ